MNINQLKQELFAKVLEAQNQNTQYEYALYMNPHHYSITVTVFHTKLRALAIEDVLRVHHMFPTEEQMERDLNHSICTMNHIIKYGRPNDGIRIALMQEMAKSLRNRNKAFTYADLAEYLDISRELGGVIDETA